MTRPRILTIILNYKTPVLTLKATEAALREMTALDGEVIVVDNASPDGSHEAILRGAQDAGWVQGGRLRIVRAPENRGFGAGNNHGMRLRMSDGGDPDFVYLLNSDAWPDPGAVGKLLEVMRNDPGTGISGSYIKGTDGAPHCTVFRFPSIASEFESAVRFGPVSRLLRRSVVRMPIPTETTRVDWVAGASMMLRGRMLDEIGAFDENFFLYYEETELCRRAARAGWATCYVPASEVTHVGSASTGLKTWARTPDYWFDSRLYYFAKVHGRLYAALATGARVAGACLWGVRRAVSGKPRVDPPHFLRDLIMHSLKTPFTGGVGRRALKGPHPMTEDGK
ncbi:glycosyltransferase family 2 protein [Roseovarius sp. SYSU LYC5161]|uniref:glycosyltransferase family 2 protein n=1 Tax=Roseovarius halophilus (ex Wu et al. 2025) TaxID=3376060 RepID=UPI00287196AE|nr:glycosyltransferase family 2 protein [Roseovarius sp.]